MAEILDNLVQESKVTDIGLKYEKCNDNLFENELHARIQKLKIGDSGTPQ